MSTLAQLQTIASGAARGDGKAAGVQLDPEIFADGIADVIARCVSPLLARIEALESRASGVNYRGVFDPAETYERGDLCTHDGAVWFACTATSERPGKSGLAFDAEGGRTMTLTEALTWTAAQLDEIVDDAMARAHAVLDRYGATEEELEAGMARQADEMKTWREQTMARLESWLRRGGETLN